MPDKALRGRGLLGVGKAKGNRLGSGMGRPGRKKPKMEGPPHIVEGKEKWDALERLGTSTSGGIEGKPHSTWRGRMSAGKNFLNRAWGQKHYNKKKKKGIEV